MNPKNAQIFSFVHELMPRWYLVGCCKENCPSDGSEADLPSLSSDKPGRYTSVTIWIEHLTDVSYLESVYIWGCGGVAGALADLFAIL